VCPNSKKGEMFLEDGKIQNLWVLGLWRKPEYKNKEVKIIFHPWLTVLACVYDYRLYTIRQLVTFHS
jgi:hypothetical protein